MFETLLADILYAFRWLRKSPAFTLLAVASFAIGIGFNTALFTLVDALLFRPLPVDRPDRLVDLYTGSSDGDIACANVASMLLARASGRQKEIGIRLAIGADRLRIVRQLITESLVMSLLGALGGLTLAWLGVAVLSAELDMIGYSPERGKAFWEQAVPRIRAIPGVDAVALTERSPLSINYNRNSIFFPERALPDDRGISTDVTRVAPEYFETLRVPILRGRGFTVGDTPQSPGVVVVNEAFAKKYWPEQDPSGRRFRTRTVDGPEFEVVGLAANYRVNTVGEKETPYIHFAASQRPQNGYEVLARTSGDAGQLLATIR